jgi:tetratricopeptide (TPR) repeat protein
VPRLLVLRGDSLEQEVRLAGGTIHIGRGAHNDVVLEDPGKSVSRDHAQIRYEGGRYVLFDLESQNGIWVSGVRAPYVVLDPDVVATVGPFQLMYDEADVGDLAQRDPSSQPPDPGGRAIKGSAKPAAKAVTSDNAGTPGPIAPRSRYATWIAAGGAALVLGGLGFGLTRVLQPEQNELVPPHLARAAALLNAGECALALEEIDSIVAANPADTAASSLRARAATCAPGSSPTSAALSVEDIAAHLDAARQLLASRDCDRALSEHLNPILAADPSNSEALALSATANTCAPASVPGAARPPPPGRFELPSAGGDCPGAARAIPPERGGLPLRDRCEPVRDYAARVQEMGTRYDEAIAALSRGAYDRAASLLERIVSDAGTGYRDAAARLEEARRKQRASRARGMAEEAEQRGDLDRAHAEYRQAQELDPSLNLQAEIARVDSLRQKIGEEACSEAKQAAAFSRQAEALRKYEVVVRMLPPEHPCVVTAKQTFPELRKR